ncbi:carbohydrate ABC transporter permease [Jiangella asiatica]|uniref:Sugar ABC transporter permease n=1 Tax=Jiangella asiatica TaxID=2530372 RepID=A0A4R5D949_9ACTN|nr:sugar ABC transporter permease [Jiangella asiatica]TDE10112.1 sugar ABC transporter permease [Jiangella asiatica]
MAIIRPARQLADARRGGDAGTLRQRLWNARWCYAFMLPSVILGTLFTLYPMIASWYISFLDWSGLDSDRHFVGLDNYSEAVADSAFWGSFGRTFAFTFVTVPVMLTLALLAALVLNDTSLRMRTVFRTMFFLPVVTTTAIVGVVMSLIMNPFDGPLNAVLLDIGIIDRPIDFLGDPDLALWSVSGVFVWKWMGMSMIYWLVALQTVPQELYEAARVDGASRWRMHRDVTIPLIMPFGIVIVLITFVGALQTFPLVQAMTSGGPAFATELVELYIYRLAFASGSTPRLGYASAVAVFFGITVLVFTLAQAWGLRRASALQRDVKQGGQA